VSRNLRSLREALERGRGIERPFNCPVHGDEHASASVNVVKGVWYCYACGASGKTMDGTHDMSYIPLLRDAPIPDMPVSAIALTNAYLGYSQYWASRYGQEVAVRFNTGVDPVTGLPTIPITDGLGTTLYGFLLRDGRAPKGEPKYRYPVGVPVSRLLFGRHLVPSRLELLVLVEGASDVLSLHRWPIPAGAAVLAVYGAGLHAAQAQIVKELAAHRVLVAMDADDPGRKANERSIAHLEALGVRGRIHDWSDLGVADPGDLEENPWTTLLP
jgi:Toprim-like/CHC2 zinc finger